ncbi:neuroendocrine convertase 1-like [Limulus polyphemus]|uniref:Neuroendocrine convertase 1-like n=1 Tax=Limulus polyphemus TaxID=6850 RepID=A0ABM1C5T2_LIMPO|nr:neuroendocrine convertase 1-like [Limulus polyphemus]
MKLVKECILLNFSIFCFIFLFAETRERSLKHNQWSEDYNKNNTAIISPPKQVKSHITSKSEQRNESLKKNFLIDVDNHLSSTNPQKKNKPSFNLDISKQTSSAFLKDSHKNGRHRRHLRTLERARTYEKPMFTNTFAMKLSGGETVAKEIAQNYELKLVRRIFDDYFLFKHNSVCRRCKRAATRHLKKWTHDNRIEWVEQQQLLIRQKRQLDPDLPEIIYDKAVELPQVEIMDNSIYYRMNEQETAILDEVDMNFNDPFYHDQWYLHNRGQIGYPTENDMNILPVWKAGYTGSGIHLAVLDDGVHPENPEIAKNYDHSISFDFVDMKDLDHQSTVNSSHGTSCASIIAAVANNSICGVGVAYEAKVGGTKILDGPVTDAQEALALTHALHIVDIYSASWGPSDNGRHLAGPGELAEKAFIRGVTQGRKGKGAIYVWAVGNGGKKFDNCNADGYASSIFTIATGALTDEGLSAYYSETCASVLASTYVGGSHKPPTRETFQRDRRKIKVVSYGFRLK